MTDPYLKINIKEKKYSKKLILKNIDLEINKGEVVAIMGPSGSGKTTLARCLVGFEDFKGNITLDGKDISSLHPKDRKIGIVPQDGSLFPHLNVEQNVGFGVRNKSEKSRKVQEFLEVVKLEDIDASRKKRIDQLSGGQQQRVAVARALATDPKVIILDESFSALDQWLRLNVRRQIIESLKTIDCTVIVITHDVNEAFELADRVAVLEGGELKQFDTSSEVYLRPASPSIASLVGIANVLPFDDDFGKGFVEITYPLSDGRDILMARPEHIQLSEKESKSLRCIVADIKVSGPNVHVFLKVKDHDIELISNSEIIASKNIGDEVDIEFSRQSIKYIAG